MVIGYIIKSVCRIGLYCLYLFCWYNLFKEKKMCFLSFELISGMEKDEECLTGGGKYNK